MNPLADALKIKPGEGRTAALLTGLMLFTSAGGSIGGNGIEALFYSRFGVQYLPYMYIALGVVTLLTSLGLTALLSRVPRQGLYVVLPLALAALLIAARALVAFNLNWFYPVLWLGMNVMGTLQGLLTWGLAGSACDTRQAKRLFPLFSAGGILGAVIGGLGTRPLVNLFHVENLLLVWAAALVLAFFAGRALAGSSRLSRPRARRGKPARLVDDIQQGYRFVQRSPLLRWMSAAVVLFAVLYFSITFPFTKAAAAQFPDADSLAGFLGLFQGLSTGAAFLASLFIANRLFARFGIMTMMLAFPIIYFVGFATVAFLPVFAALVVFRFAQMAWLQGIAGTAYQTLLNVVPPERRDQTRTFIDGVPGQAGIVIAGLILVIGEQAFKPGQLYFLGLGAAILATVVVWQAGRAYGRALVDALRAGQPQLFFGEEEPFGGFRRDASAVGAAVAGIASPDPAVRRVSAEILGNLSAPQATEALVEALGDADSQVRAASLRGLARAQASPALLDVAARLRDPEPEVRAQAVEAVRRLAAYPRGVISHLEPLLDDPDSAVRTRAAVIVLKAGAHPEAREMLRSLAVMGEPRERALALTALGEWGDAEAFELVAVEMEVHGAPAVTLRAAASALARFDGGRAIPVLIGALGHDDTSVREAVALALGQFGEAALAPVVAALSDPDRQSGALTALGHLPALRAASAIRDYALEGSQKALHYHGHARQIDSAGDERAQLLADSLGDKARRQALYCLRAVGLLGDRVAVTVAIENLRSHDAAQRANALETFDALGEAKIVRPLMQIWESPVETTRRVVSTDDLLHIMSDSDSWLRACAALAARESDDPQVQTALKALTQTDPDAVVRETAALSAQKGSPMDTLATLSLMERILFLRRVPLFADLSPADLKQVAAIASELAYPDGEGIARQGDPGDEMYVIVSGEVRVLSAPGDGKEVEVARRRTGDIVGEMAIISREPRMASLVAAGDVRALVIDQKQFEGLLRERPETCLAVMRVLCARLKEKAALPTWAEN